MTAVLAAAAVALALALDLAVGEPPRRLHPVAWFGRLVAPFDRSRRRPTAVGALAALTLPLTAAGAVAAVVAAGLVVSDAVGVALAGLVLFVASSLRRLRTRAREVIAESDRDLGAARHDLRALAGRDAATLSAGEVRSAAVESAAENLADGLVAPLAGFVGGALVGVALAPALGVGPALALPLSAAGAAWMKAVNTLDSMLGYHSKPVGRVPARLDDAAMWLPARAGALLLALAARRPTAALAARRWLDRVPSPNSGWPMGTLAAAGEVRLEKPGAYVLNPDADLPSTATARAGVRTTVVAGLAAYALAALLLSGAGVAT